MKNLSLLVSVLCMQVSVSFATEIISNQIVRPKRLIALGSTIILDPSYSYLKRDLIGTDQSVNSDDGRHLLYYWSLHDKYLGTSNGITDMTNTFIPDLTPKGSNITHAISGNNGYIENMALAGGMLFTTNLLPSKQSFLYSESKQEALLNLGEPSLAQDSANIRPMHSPIGGLKFFNYNVPTFYLSAQPVFDTSKLYYGDYYNSNNTVALWTSLDSGLNWNKVIEWSSAVYPTLHIRGVRINPNNKWVYILFGDAANESAIVAWDGKSAVPPNNTVLDKLGTFPGWKSIVGANTKTGDLVFAKGKCIWIPEVTTLPAGQKLYAQRANYDLSNWEETGAVEFVNNIPPTIGAKPYDGIPQMSPNPPYPTQDTGNVYWASYKNSNAPEQKVHIWKSTDTGLTWKLINKINVYTTGTAVPTAFSVVGKPGTAGTKSVVDTVTLTGRALEFSATGKQTGSQVSFDSTYQVDIATANNDTVNTSKNQPVTINMMSNDTNIGASIVSITGYPENGGLAYTDSTQRSVIYTPNANFTGTDTFTYTLKNVAGVSNTATVTIMVNNTTPPPSGSAVATADTGSTALGTPVTLNLTSNDTNVGTSIVNIVGYPGHGNVAYSDSTSKSITYTPNATFTGTDTFTYNLKSSAGTSNTVTVTITVGGTTPPPTGTGAVANGDTMTTTKGTPVTLNLTSNDTNVGTSTVNIAGYPNNGNVAYSDSTKKSVTYTPDATFVGSDSFTYNLKSASGTSNTATVSVKVQ